MKLRRKISDTLNVKKKNQLREKGTPEITPLLRAVLAKGEVLVRIRFHN